MISKIDGTCQFEGCSQTATAIASGRRDYQDRPAEGCHDIGCYCEMHAKVVAMEDDPEYEDVCPNCGCRFGCG